MDAPDTMQEFLHYHRRMLAFLLGLCLVVAGGMVVLLPRDRALLGGFLVGSAAQLVKFAFIDVGVVRHMTGAEEKALLWKMKAWYGSLLILLPAVIVTLKFRLNPWAFTSGVLLPRMMLIADLYLRPNIFAKQVAAIESVRILREKAKDGNEGEKPDER